MLLVPNTGVITFFVLSGFLISYRYGRIKFDDSNKYNYFLISRFARIYPLYIVVTIVTLLWQQNYNGGHWLLNVTLLKGYFNTEKFTGIPQTWSLTVQETFYLLAPLLLIGFRRRAALTLMSIYLTGMCLVSLSKNLGLNSFMASAGFMLEYTFFGFAFSFYCGYILAQKFNNQNTGSRSGVPKYTYVGTALILITVYTVARYSTRLPWPYFPPVSSILMLFIYPLGVSVLLYGLIKENSWLAKILASTPAQWLGKGSYAFYLIHGGIFFEIIYFQVSKNLLVIFLIFNALAIAIYYFLENPLYVYIRKKLKLRPKYFLSPPDK